MHISRTLNLLKWMGEISRVEALMLYCLFVFQDVLTCVCGMAVARCAAMVMAYRAAAVPGIQLAPCVVPSVLVTQIGRSDPCLSDGIQLKKEA